MHNLFSTDLGQQSKPNPTIGNLWLFLNSVSFFLTFLNFILASLAPGWSRRSDCQVASRCRHQNIWFYCSGIVNSNWRYSRKSLAKSCLHLTKKKTKNIDTPNSGGKACISFRSQAEGSSRPDTKRNSHCCANNASRTLQCPSCKRKIFIPSSKRFEREHQAARGLHFVCGNPRLLESGIVVLCILAHITCTSIT